METAIGKTDKPGLKIFVCHTSGKINMQPKNPNYIHMIGGAALCNDNIQDGLTGDNTGDNISIKNRSYCELTVQYWAWKNVDLDYYGFCHYRRFFSFNPPENQVPDNFANVTFDFFEKKALNQIIFEPEEVIAKMDASPIAMTTPFNVRNLDVSNVYEQYATTEFLHKKDFDILLDVIHEFSPQFDEATRECIKGHIVFPCNMFIMKKELFFRYCEWLFPVLQECERRIDFSNYDIDELRFIGHLGERCLGIFYSYLHKYENINAVFFQRLLIVDKDNSTKVNNRAVNFGQGIKLALKKIISPLFPTGSKGRIFFKKIYYQFLKQ